MMSDSPESAGQPPSFSNSSPQEQALTSTQSDAFREFPSVRLLGFRPPPRPGRPPGPTAGAKKGPKKKDTKTQSKRSAAQPGIGRFFAGQGDGSLSIPGSTQVHGNARSPLRSSTVPEREFPHLGGVSRYFPMGSGEQEEQTLRQESDSDFDEAPIEEEEEEEAEEGDNMNMEESSGEEENLNQGLPLSGYTSQRQRTDHERKNEEEETPKTNTPGQARSDAVEVGTDLPERYERLDSAGLTVPAELNTASDDEFPQKRSHSPVKGSQSEFQSQKRRKTPDNQLTVDDVDAESYSCVICMEPWTTSGKHRLVCIKCGHCFGRSCIVRWMKDSKKKNKSARCPQCQMPTNPGHVREIYAPVLLAAVDTSDMVAVTRELDAERELRIQAEREAARAKLQAQLLQSQTEKLKQEVEELRRRTVPGRPLGPDTTVGAPSANQKETKGPGGCYVPQATVEVSKEQKARVVDFDSQQCVFAVSGEVKPQMAHFTKHKFGIQKVSATDCRHTEYIGLHDGAVRDVRFRPAGGYLLTASLDKTARLSDMSNKNVVHTFELPHGAWAVNWDPFDPNLFYVGMEKGLVVTYDIRQPDRHVSEIRTDLATVPVLNVSPLPHINVDSVGLSQSPCLPGSNPTGNSGLLIGCIKGARFWEKKGQTNYEPHVMQLPDGACAWTSAAPYTRRCLATLRPGAQHPNIFDVGLEGSSVVAQFEAGNTMRTLSRATLFPSPAKSQNHFLAAPDEASSTVLVWDVASGSLVQRLPTRGPGMDVKAYSHANGACLATLTMSHLMLAKWVPTC